MEEKFYSEPPKTLAEAKERVGSEIELDKYGLVKTPQIPGDCSDILAPILGVVCAIVLNIFFCGKILGSFLDLIILGAAGLLGGYTLGLLFGIYVCPIFASKERKKEYLSNLSKARSLNEKYNLKRIEPEKTDSSEKSDNLTHCCPECGGHVTVINKEIRVGDVGTVGRTAHRTKTTYKCESCGFVYYSIQMEARETNKAVSTFFDGDYELHNIVTKSLKYKTDSKCSLKALNKLRNSGYEKTIDETKEAKKEAKRAAKQDGDNW